MRADCLTSPFCLRCDSVLFIYLFLSNKYSSSTVWLRSLKTHRRYCQLLGTGLSDHFSRTYGVNRLSILDKAPYFDVCRCLQHDIMHIIFEGVLVLHRRKLLTYCIKKKGYFTLSFLNDKIQNFQYGYSESRTIPSLTDGDRLVEDNSTKLGQSGEY